MMKTLLSTYFSRSFTFVFVFTLLSFSGLLSAQNGILKGVVTDKGDKSTMPGVTVAIKEISTLGTSTNLDGEFLIPNVPKGNYTLVFSFLYYAEKEVPVVVEPGDNPALTIEMAPEEVVGQEVIITAQALGQSKAINQQLNSDAIANIVSADKIKELPDVNAAEAISRLPGVAINRSGGEGSKVVIRGLDPKFTAISVNGVRLPSTSPDDRSIDLSLISPELLSGIELFKSPTPDMDGDALGGAVNLSITRAPKERKITIKGLGGFNALASTTTDYKVSGSLAQRVLNDRIGVVLNVNTERFNRSGQITNQSWSDDLKTPLDTIKDIFAQLGNNLSYIQSKETRKRNNASLGLDFKIGENSDFNILGLYSKTSRERYVHREDYNLAQGRISYFPNVVDNAINLLSFSFAGSHKLSAVQIDYGLANSDVKGETPLDYQVEFRNDRLPFAPNAQDLRKDPSIFFSLNQRKLDVDYLQGLTVNKSENNENIKTAFVNFNVPIITNEKYSLSFKTGSKYVKSKKDRVLEQKRNVVQYYLYSNNYFKEFSSEGKGATGVDASGATYYSMHNFTTNDIIKFQTPGGEKVDLLSSFDVEKLNRFVDIYSKKPKAEIDKNYYQDTENYDLDESVFANYAMLKFKLGSSLTVIPGVRHEQSNNGYRGIYSDLNGDLGINGDSKPVRDSVKYGVLMPHLHIKFKPASWFDVRASYSTTLARPDYSFLIPFTSVNRSGDLMIDKGNSQLKPSVSKNLDLYFTFYTSKFGLLSVGGFNKDIKDIFYPFTVGLNNDTLAKAYGFPASGFIGGELQTFVNSPDSYVRGVEFEYQTNLNFLPGFLKKFVLSVNYSLLFSKTTINSFTEETFFKRISPTRPPVRVVVITPVQRVVDLIGQASNLFNASLGFDHGGFSARGSASYQGNKISGYSAAADKDRYNKGFYRFDLALKQKFGSNFNIFLNINNLSDQRDINFFRDENFMTSTARYGRTATFGAEYILR
jgi:TonB-dependent receptor